MWKEVYVLPFHNDEDCEVYVRDSNNNTVFNKCERNPEIYEKILTKLNGLSDDIIPVTQSDCYILYEGRRILTIRGWGRLTGTGFHGMNLSSKDACKIQDDFGKWVVETLNK